MWILFILVYAYGGPAMSSGEFTSQLACENAKVEIYRNFTDSHNTVKGVCVQK